VETNVTKRVLIVDNEPNVVGVLLEFFARFQHGHANDVVSAYSAAEALDILLREDRICSFRPRANRAS
jgi:CheY-like chemotaxis protein